MQLHEPAPVVPALDVHARGIVGLAVALLHERDAETGDHCRRVTALAAAVCDELGRAADDQSVWGFLLHDIGKIGIPDSILRKPGPLSPAEWAVVRTHPEIGARVLREARVLEGAIPVVLHHHERWDGGGYPSGLAGRAIPFAARAFAVADAFDAITHSRVYRAGRGHQTALAVVLANAGSQFDPECVGALSSVVRSGSWVDRPTLRGLFSVPG